MAISQTSIRFAQKTVKKIASGVTEATVDKHWREGRDLQYISMIKSADEAAPTEYEILHHGRRMFQNSDDQETIESQESSDVYAYCSSEGDETTMGRLVLTVAT